MLALLAVLVVFAAVSAALRRSKAGARAAAGRTAGFGASGWVRFLPHLRGDTRSVLEPGWKGLAYIFVESKIGDIGHAGAGTPDNSEAMPWEKAR